MISGYLGYFNPSNTQATIASGGNTSSAINTGGMCLCGIFIPSSFTSTAITFQASADGENFYPLKNTTSGTDLSYTVAQGTYCAIDPQDFYGIQYFKIISGSNEAAARTLTCSLKGV